MTTTESVSKQIQDLRSQLCVGDSHPHLSTVRAAVEWLAHLETAVDAASGLWGVEPCHILQELDLQLDTLLKA